MNTINLIQQAYRDFQNGNTRQAEQVLNNILQSQPANVDALHILGVIHAANGQRPQAIGLFQRALAQDPNNVSLHYKLARVQFESGEFTAALQAYERIIALGYVKPEILLAKTAALVNLQRHLEALACLEQALARWPDYADGWAHKGAICCQLRHYDEALLCLDQALALQPAMADGWYKKSLALDKLERYTEALACADRAVSLAPHSAAYRLDRAVILHKLERYDEALSDHEQGLALAPANAEAWGDHGLTLSRMKRHEQALASYGRALSLQSGYADVLSNQSLSQLVLGQFDAGWQSYEYRWKKGNADTPRHTDLPLWLGQHDIAGKRILLWSEQGLGDTIQFCRYATLVAALGAEVVLEVDPTLKTIAQTLGGFQVIAIGESVPPVDYQTPLMSLPLVFKTDLASIPAGPAYLHADRDKREHWRSRQDFANGKMKIGLVCSGNPGNTNDHRRSMPLQDFAPLLQSDAADFFLIQKEVRESDLAFLQQNPKLRLPAADIDGFDDTAAIIANLDLVISVDTSIAHLSGALGVPVWILLPWVPDWRWLLDREDSPWYPSARLLRQNAAGNWHGLIQRVAEELNDFLSVSLKIS
ncbi:tetratricopeptide repeat protein [Collimonas pratensis]|uniref:tetratricopeptide repeat protein n=1 Tax=Collimonas pratensis TaxID=279113 RepID=UPI00143D9E3D|nr:tetratricopeptide repeat protein [Collimonas pratensis]NKI70282.1 tetratricopeptide repeat protein [Collimonas pratensis]